VSKPSGWDDLASFGHMRQRRWIILFEDAEMGMMVFDNEDEAHARYESLSITWNCHLMETCLRLRPARGKDKTDA
jgi:hypothetical protein